MVDTNNSNTVELTQEDLNEVNTEFAMLAAALGAPLPREFVYTPEAGVALKVLLDTALEDAQVMLDAGVADGSIVHPAAPLKLLTNEDILAQALAANSGGIDIAVVQGIINDAEQNISILDQVSTQLASATNSNTVLAEAKPVPVDSSIQSDPRIARIETALTQIVPILNGLENMENLTLRPTTEIPVPGTVDGYLDQASLDSYQQTMQQLNYLAAINDTNIMLKASMIAGTTDLPLDQKIAHFVPGNAEAIETLLVDSITESITDKGKELSALEGSGTATAAQIAAVKAEIIELNTLKTQTIPQVLQDMAALHASNSLSAAVDMRMSEPATVTVQTPTNTTGVTPVVPNPVDAGTSLAAADADVDTSIDDILNGNAAAQNANEVEKSIEIVEATLFDLGGQLDKMVGQFGGIAQGLAGSLVTPLTQADLDDRDADGHLVLGENSQDLTSKLIMMLKTLDGQKNPNGVYTETIGRQLQLAILTKDDFSMIREQMGIDKVTPAEAQALIARPPTEVPPLAEGADAAQQAAHIAATATYNQQKAEYDSSAAKTDKLNILFHSLDVLRQNGALDEEKARSTTKMNMIMDGLAGALDNFAPGFKDALKDFFTNSDFGKMIGGMLTMFGININRLWGDKDDSAALQNAAGLVGDGFETAFDKVAADNNLDPKLDFDKIMDLTKDSFQEQMDGFLPRNAMKLMLGDADADQIKAALSDAMDRAAGAGDMDSAKQVFVDRLVQIGEAYKNGTGITLLTHVETIGQTIEDVVAERPELAASAPVSASSSTISSSSVSPAAYVASEPAVDLPVVPAGESRVELEYERSTETFEQDPERYSQGRVAQIQEVLYNNAALLAISAVNPEFMRDTDNVNASSDFTDTMTRETCGVFEEVWIRANIHAMVEAGTEITQEGLEEIAQTRLSSENMGVILTYMHDKNVPQADIDTFSRNMLALDKDYASSADGATKTVSVFDQALLWGQLTPNIAQWVPEQAPVVIVPDPVVPNDGDDVTTDANDDPLRDRYMEYNKDNLPCDIPLFYTQEGSDSVFALVRIKTDGPLDNDPSNDTFKVLELENYLNTKSLDDPEQLAVFLDNYNWRNPTKEGVENVINKILCLEPRAQADNTNTPESTHTDDAVTMTFNTQAEVHYTPESFRDLRILDEGKAAFLLEGLDLANDRPDLMERAARNHDMPLNTFFADALGLQDGTTPFVFLELEAHGLHHDDFDVVIAMRSGSSIEYRFVDYDTDFIKPLPDQRAGGAKDMAEGIAPAQGGRRMDDLLRVIERLPGGHIIHGAEGGYAQMSAIIPNGQDRLGLTNGLKAVYGSHMTTHANQLAYAGGVTSRYSESSRYENSGPRDYSQSDRQAEFNDRSGTQRGNFFTRLFSNGKSRDEETPNDDINDNIRDIGDGENYDPATLDTAAPEREVTRESLIALAAAAGG